MRKRLVCGRYPGVCQEDHDKSCSISTLLCQGVIQTLQLLHQLETFRATTILAYGISQLAGSAARAAYYGGRASTIELTLQP